MDIEESATVLFQRLGLQEEEIDPAALETVHIFEDMHILKKNILPYCEAFITKLGIININDLKLLEKSAYNYRLREIMLIGDYLKFASYCESSTSKA